MSNESFEEAFNFFLEEHIILKDEWLRSAIDFLIGRFPGIRGDRLNKLIFEQWLHTNLVESTFPTLESIDTKSRKVNIDQPIILQITSLVDMGNSLLSQFNKLTYEFVDNSGFEAIQEDKNDNLYRPKSSRCILLSLSDGVNEVKGMERSLIPSLSLLTLPGVKILICPPVVCRKGILLLSKDKVQVLGGDDNILMENGRPLHVMSKILKKKIPKKRSSFNSSPSSNIDEQPKQDDIEQFEEMEDAFDPNDFEPIPSSSTRVTPRPPPRSIPPTNTVSPLKRSIINTVSPTHRSMHNTVSPSSRSISSKVPPIPISTELVSTQTTASTGVPSQSSNRIEVKKEVKTEPMDIIEIDDEDIDMPSTSNSSSGQNGSITKVKKEEEEDQFVLSYRSLKLITLDEALKQAKFLSTSSIRKIQAIVDTFIDPCRIVDELWTMRLTIRDHTRDGIDCIVHSSLLERLIGFTVDEAKRIRQSTDISRKREGANRLKATEEILNRLDLIWYIEWFSTKTNSPPVVRNVQTLSEILNVFDS